MVIVCHGKFVTINIQYSCTKE